MVFTGVLLWWTGGLWMVMPPLLVPAPYAEQVYVPYYLGVTMEGFLALKPGMRKLDVDWILFGHKPTLVSATGPQATYTWEKDGRTIGVVFQN